MSMLSFDGGYCKANRDAFEPLLKGLGSGELTNGDARIYWGLCVINARLGCYSCGDSAYIDAADQQTAIIPELIKITRLKIKPGRVWESITRLQVQGCIDQFFAPLNFTPQASASYIIVPRRALYYLARTTYRTDHAVVMHFFKYLLNSPTGPRCRLNRRLLEEQYGVGRRAQYDAIKRLQDEGMIMKEEGRTNTNGWWVTKYGTAYKILTNWLPRAIERGAKISAAIRSKTLSSKNSPNPAQPNSYLQDFRRLIKRKYKRWKESNAGKWKIRFFEGHQYEERVTFEGIVQAKIAGEVYSHPQKWFLRHIFSS